MKSIILFRHARAERCDLGRDHDRPLASKGIADAKKMGLYLSGEKLLPEIVISSTALRAKMTGETAMEEGKWSCPLILESGIYGGVPLFLLNLVNKQDDAISSICLVGHEPNFSRFIASATRMKYVCFPTASMAKVEFNVIKWGDVIMDLGNLDWLLSPEHLFSM